MKNTNYHQYLSYDYPEQCTKWRNRINYQGGITLPKYSYLNGGSSEDRSVYQGITGGITFMQYKISWESPGLGFGLSVDFLQAGDNQ